MAASRVVEIGRPARAMVGWIMAQVDLAGYVIPRRVGKGRVARGRSISSSSSSRCRRATR